MADIDLFKSVNDTYGHPVGDQVIKLVAKFLQSSLRPTDLLCRYGGEEFCILLPNLDWEGALQIAGRIRSSIEANCGRGVRDVKDLRVTSSFGIGSIGPGVDTLAELINQADQGLYGAKRTGRNRVFLYKNLKDYPELATAEAGH
jgi:diguanylate cyclase (GGDEF)-like protein